MKNFRMASQWFNTALIFCVIIGFGTSQGFAEEKKATETVTPKGELVRLAYNDEGWVTLGYRIANGSVGDEWMLLEVGITVQPGTAEYKLTRDKVTMTTPDGKVIPLASQEDYSKAGLRALDARASQVRDSINYFPPGANVPCRIGFFTDVSQRIRGGSHDQVSLHNQRACAGRLYFKVPGNIQYGQHFLNVGFASSTLRVPFKIMTKDELKAAKKEWKAMVKEQKKKEKEAKKAAKEAAKN